MGLLNTEDYAKVSQFGVFQGISAEMLRSALSNASVRNLKHREFLYQVGEVAESFCLVVEGAIKIIRHSPKGEDVIVHFAVPGDLVGALLMNEEKLTTFPVSAKSMGPTRVICIPRSTFVNFWKGNSQLLTKLNSILYRRMSNIQDDKSLVSSPLKSRIAYLLFRHLDQTLDVPKQVLTITLTRQEIADSLGVAVESVIRCMRDLQSEGIISRPDEKGPEYINIEKLLKLIQD